jgi:predicted DNA-binding transcriptional regulator AlpA
MTTTSETALSRDERRGALAQLDCVRTIEETAALLSLGVPTLRTMLQRGQGPKITRLSARRIGIRDSHREAWLEAQSVG